MNVVMKRLAARLPARWQQELKRMYFGRQLRRSRFRTDEREFGRLHEMLGAGDWALDIGANIGHYTARFSELVGPGGRVIAFEPVPETFELLAANAALMRYRNVTLINAAASSQTSVAHIEIPRFRESGLDNYYMAHLSADTAGPAVLCVAVDSLALSHRIRLAKIDAEGHELAVLQGMRVLLARDRPLLIVEDNVAAVQAFLQPFGYSSEKLAGSSNRIFRATSVPAAATAPAALEGEPK